MVRLDNVVVRLNNTIYKDISLSVYIVSDVSELVCPAVEGGIYIVYNDTDFYDSDVYIFKDNFFHKLKEKAIILDKTNMEITDRLYPHLSQ